MTSFITSDLSQNLTFDSTLGSLNKLSFSQYSIVTIIQSSTVPEIDGLWRHRDDDHDLGAALDGLAILVGGEDPALPDAVVLLGDRAHLK